MEMTSNAYLFDGIGNVEFITSANQAQIHFEYEGKEQSADFTSTQFYHNNKFLVDGEDLQKYIQNGSSVIFSCQQKSDTWHVIICFLYKESHWNEIVPTVGITNGCGYITKLKKRHGILVMIDLLNKQNKVLFLMNRVYIDGKRVTSSIKLSEELDNSVMFDAIPTFAIENDDNCTWFATVVFKGKKPDNNPSTIVLHEAVKSTPITNEKTLISVAKELNVKLSMKNTKNTFVEKQNISCNDKAVIKSDTPNIENKCQLLDNIQKPQDIIQTISRYINDSRNIFITGQGILLDIVNEEYGILLGEFKPNDFQPILFHRKNAFLFKMKLSHSKLSEIFIEGDRLRFIAVRAPYGFVTSWIAIQVSVQSYEQTLKSV
ncbi:uncharacterized protein LOC105696079 [Orussus abietinus]|uniref:uncharacterized protein LOC105696079 n=1 Tax=Orussus abietinus TaxID=222816 RepID=UPI0006262CF4|nr:uncharacterized protein LOC105696079 [Orussus abietinus]